MGKKEQVEQLTTYMANFVSYIGKVLPDDIIAKIRRTGRKRGQSSFQGNLSDHAEKSGSCKRIEQTKLPGYRCSYSSG